MRTYSSSTVRTLRHPWQVQDPQWSPPGSQKWGRDGAQQTEPLLRGAKEWTAQERRGEERRQDKVEEKVEEKVK